MEDRLLHGIRSCIFDALDDVLVKGRSHDLIKQQQSNPGLNGYREHVVPCNSIATQAISMIRHGVEDAIVAGMIERMCCIILISEKEARTLNACNLKNKMPIDWEFGEDADIYMRLSEVGITWEPFPIGWQSSSSSGAVGNDAASPHTSPMPAAKSQRCRSRSHETARWNGECVAAPSPNATVEMRSIKSALALNGVRGDPITAFSEVVADGVVMPTHANAPPPIPRSRNQSRSRSSSARWPTGEVNDVVEPPLPSKNHFPEGAEVEAHSVKSQPALNGARGIVVHLDGVSTERVCVKFPTHEEPLALRPAN